MPIAPFGSVFWFRVKALAPLFDHGWKHEDFPPEPLPQDGTISHAIERIYPFVAQGAGYYPAQAMSADYAVARCDSMQAYASGLIRPLARVFDCTTFGSAAASAGAFAARKHWFGLETMARMRIPSAAAPATGCVSGCRNPLTKT